MEWIAITANVATALGFFLLAWQLRLGRDALRAQTRAIEVQTYTSMALEFLSTVTLFQEHINDPGIGEADLSGEERRAVDRYFYFANMEYMLVKQNAVNRDAATNWLQGIKSSAKKKCLVERWRSTTSRFTLDPDFRKFYEEAINEAHLGQDTS